MCMLIIAAFLHFLFVLQYQIGIRASFDLIIIFLKLQTQPPKKLTSTNRNESL